MCEKGREKAKLRAAEEKKKAERKKKQAELEAIEKRASELKELLAVEEAAPVEE